MSEVILDHEATYEDLLELPEHVVAEIVEGRLFSSPRPPAWPAYAKGGLLVQLMRRYDNGDGGPGGWWFIYEPEIHLGQDVLVPDIAGWRRERVPTIPDVEWMDVVPDWLCETVHPQIERLDRQVKMPRYAHHGVPHVWIVDTATRSVEVYHCIGEHMLLLSTHRGARIRVEPFTAVDLSLEMLWPA